MRMVGHHRCNVFLSGTLEKSRRQLSRAHHMGWLLCLLAGLMGCATADLSDQETWRTLFNGKDLDGWQVKIKGYAFGDNFGETFRVVDSALTVDYAAYDTFDQRFGHIYYEESFSHYRLRIRYRFIGAQVPGGPGWAVRNSGIMVHGQPPASVLKDQDFPISLEAQLLGGDGVQERPTMNLCTPGTHVHMEDTLTTRHCMRSESATYHGDQWVNAEMLVLGDSLVVHYVEGQEVLRFTKPQIGGAVVNNYDPHHKPDGAPLTSGHISLQSESHPVQFSKVELLDLCGCMDPKAKNYKSYFVESDNSRCQY